MMNFQRLTRYSTITAVIAMALIGAPAKARQDAPPPPPTPPGVDAHVSTNVSQPFSAIPPVPAQPVVAAPAIPPPPTTRPTTLTPGMTPRPFTSVKVQLSATVTNDMLTLSWPRDAAGALLFQLSGSSTRWDPIPAGMYHTNNREISVSVPVPLLTTFYRVGAEVPSEPVNRQQVPQPGPARRPPTRKPPTSPSEP